MASRPPAAPSPQARRQAQILAFQAALVARDTNLVECLMGQWVHRQGMGSVLALSQELASAEPEGWSWWQAQQSQSAQLDLSVGADVELEAEPVPERLVPEVPARRLEPQVPRASRPAPASSHPAVVQLRTWLPDQESVRAA